MKRIFIVAALLAVLLVLLAAGASCSEEKITVLLGNDFELHVGETALIEGEGLKLTFLEVEEDSRCPEGVECIQAGQVTCRVRVNYHGAVSEISMTHYGTSILSSGTLGDYNIGFTVKPYPKEGQEIAESEYILMMTVTK